MPKPAQDNLHDSYWRAMLNGLVNEILDESKVHTVLPDCITGAINQSLSLLKDIDSSNSNEILSSRYRTLSDFWSGHLVSREAVADMYRTMDEFWAALDAQRAGKASGTIWDSYEHGRRRQIEKLLSVVIGVQDTILVNTGMSAVTVAIESCSPTKCTRILTSDKLYFETAELFTEVLERRGCLIQRNDFADAEQLADHIHIFAPDIVYFETVTNTIDLKSSIEAINIIGSFPKTIFICDNTLFSTLPVIWCGLSFPDNLLIVESATKYISQKVMAGLIYGCNSTVSRAREIARTYGQQLCGHSVCYIRKGEIPLVRHRLALHRRNAAILTQIRPDVFPGLRIERPKFSSYSETEEHDGTLVYIALKNAEAPGQANRLRRIVECWNERLLSLGLFIPVRAGFGWDETTYRIYETSGLNQVEAPTYLRISAGVEPEPVIREIAKALWSSLEEANYGNVPAS